MAPVTTVKWNHRGEEPFLRLTRRQNKTLDLRKTTLEWSVHVQAFGLNAEKIIPAPSPKERFSLDIPFYRTWTKNALFVEVVSNKPVGRLSLW